MAEVDATTIQMLWFRRQRANLDILVGAMENNDLWLAMRTMKDINDLSNASLPTDVGGALLLASFDPESVWEMVEATIGKTSEAELAYTMACERYNAAMDFKGVLMFDTEEQAREFVEQGGLE